MANPDLPRPDESVAYADAIREIEEILSRIEEADIDVDSLSQSVERAAVLLRLCRERVARAELRVKQVLAQIVEEPPWTEEEPTDT